MSVCFQKFLSRKCLKLTNSIKYGKNIYTKLYRFYLNKLLINIKPEIISLVRCCFHLIDACG